jgi:hypothetical protein
MCIRCAQKQKLTYLIIPGDTDTTAKFKWDVFDAPNITSVFIGAPDATDFFRLSMQAHQRIHRLLLAAFMFN